jgi:adenylate cyclase
MSGDPEQEYFSDGITEDIISELSRFRELFVIARNSSFIFKEQNINVSEVASKLGVQYLVEGSVRKVANRVRVTAQLVDGATASHIWADRYDREMEDIFTVQDEVVAAIVSALPNQIRHVELARPQRTTADIKAYDLVLHAAAQGLDTLKDAARAIALLEQALEIEPGYALAHSWLANAYTMEWDHRLIPKPEAVAAKIMKHGRRAVELDQTDGSAYQVLSDHCLFIMEDLTEARVHAERAVQLNPNASSIIAWRGYIHNCDGESKQAMELCARATRLDPLAFGWVKFLHGVVYFDAGQYDRAIDMFLATNWEEKWPHLAAAYALTGQKERAREIAKRSRKIWIESTPQDLDERIQEIFIKGGWYNHGNLDGSLEKGLRIAGFFG